MVWKALAVARAANDTGEIVTAEEHRIHNGLGDAVAHVCAEKRCTWPCAESRKRFAINLLCALVASLNR